MKTLIIAEKPSVARDIAAALGGFQKKGDWLERDDAIVSSGIGHLVRIDGPAWTGRGFEALPAIPDAFALKAIPNTESQLKLVGKLMARPDVTTIVNACDAGREGELIFRLIYEYSQVCKPVKRMWLQSMTAGAIKDAFRAMKDGRQYDALGAAARCRSEADWLVGINGSRGMTVLSETLTGQRQLRTVGRVQTPTLGILVHRELEISNFKPVPYWELHATFQLVSGQYKARWCSQQGLASAASDKQESGAGDEDAGFRINDAARAQALLLKCQGQQPTSVRDESKRTTSAVPRLFDLTTLQREANRRFKFSAKKTLDLTQALYEKHKAVTYPRTDSNALPEDYIPKTVSVMQAFAGASGEFAAHAQRVLDGDWIKPAKRIFDNSKISDHFAIIPTGAMPEGLSGDEFKIFGLIVRRFIAAFYPAAQYDSTLRTTIVAGETFLARGRVLVDPGWLVVFGQGLDDADADAKQPALCALTPGEQAGTRDMHIEALQTKPPSRLTEATLLAAMETAGKLIEDDALRDAMKERGLGTPATRAAILETLLAIKDGRGNPIEPYVTREGKAQHLVPTDKGIQLVQFLEANGLDALTSPVLTGDWEAKLMQVEKGRGQAQAFMQEIRSFTIQMIDTLKAKAASAPQAVATDLGAPCPACKKSMQASGRGFSCVCGFSLSRVIAGRQITDEEARALFEKGKTAVLSGFHSKAKKKDFSAGLELVDGKAQFYFAPREEAAPAGVSVPCPVCHKPLRQCTGAKGVFWGCAGYPDCKTTLPDDNGKPGKRLEPGAGRMSANEVNQAAAGRAATPKGQQGEVCPTCAKGKLQRRPSRQSDRFFLGCSTFPACRHFQWDNR